MIVTLACGHSRSLDDNTGEAIGVGHICYCTLHKTNSRIVSMNASPKPRPPRAVIDSMLSCVLRMIQDAYKLDQTGDTWENILARAKVRLYDDLDAAAGPPRYDSPAPPPVDWEAKYAAILKRCNELQEFIKAPEYGQWGPDWNSVVARINSLVKP